MTHRQTNSKFVIQASGTLFDAMPGRSRSRRSGSLHRSCSRASRRGSKQDSPLKCPQQVDEEDEACPSSPSETREDIMGEQFLQCHDQHTKKAEKRQFKSRKLSGCQRRKRPRRRKCELKGEQHEKFCRRFGSDDGKDLACL